jgi:hypothetical protein
MTTQSRVALAAEVKRLADEAISSAESVGHPLAGGMAIRRLADDQAALHLAIDALAACQPEQEQETDLVAAVTDVLNAARYDPAHDNTRLAILIMMRLSSLPDSEGPEQQAAEPVGRIETYVGEPGSKWPVAPFNRVVWANGMQPPPGTLLYTHPAPTQKPAAQSDVLEEAMRLAHAYARFHAGVGITSHSQDRSTEACAALRTFLSTHLR